MLTNEIVMRFKDVKKDSNGYKCKCPAHKDKQASLSVKHSNDKTMIYCQAGCETDDILNAVGLKMADLFDNAKENHHADKFENEEEVEKYLMTITFNNKKVTNFYKYVDATGKLLYYKIRLQDNEGNKEFMFIRYFNKSKILVWGLSGGYKYETFEGSKQYSSKEKKGAKVIEVKEQPKELYNLKGLEYAKEEGYPIFIVEGEKDVDTMKKIGLIAVSSPTGGGKGKEKWLDSYSKLFKGADVVIMPDNDRPGQEFGEIVQQSLLNYCYKTRVYTISNTPKGDITDWYNSLDEASKNNAKSIILEKIRLLKPKCPKWYTVTEKTKIINKVPEIVDYNIDLRQNYFAKYLLKALDLELVANSSMDNPIPHIYKNGVYEARKNIQKEIAEYLNIDRVSPELLSKIEKLMIETGEYTVRDTSYFDGDIHKINFKNGIYDIKTNEFTPHTPDYKTVIQLECNYNPRATKSSYWDNYINDLSEGNESHKIILQEMAGLVISNIPGSYLKKMLGLWGKGDTGKGKFWDILGRILGKKAVTSIDLQKLSGDNQFNTSRLYGKAFAYSGDMTKKAIQDPTILKQLTGGDNITAEFKGRNGFDFKFMGVYAMACNNLPVIMDDHGQHLYNRLQILPCNNVIPVEKRNKTLVKDCIEYDSEYIVNWAIEGAKRLLNNNYEFSYCESVEEVRATYKAISDSVFAFIEEKYDITGDLKDRIAVSVLRNEYNSYCIDEGIQRPVSKKKEFIERCKAIKGLTFGKVKVDCIKGIKVKEFTEAEEKTPFEE